MVLVAGLAVRHLLVDALEPAEAESIIRAAHARELSAEYLPRVESPDGAYDREVTLTLDRGGETLTKRRTPARTQESNPITTETK